MSELHINIYDVADAERLKPKTSLAVIYNNASFIEAAQYFLTKKTEINFRAIVCALNMYRFGANPVLDNFSNLDKDFLEHCRAMEEKARELYSIINGGSNRKPMICNPYKEYSVEDCKKEGVKLMHIDNGFKCRIIADALADKTTEFVDSKVSRDDYLNIQVMEVSEQLRYLNAKGIKVISFPAGTITAIKGMYNGKEEDFWAEDAQVHRRTFLGKEEVRFGMLLG